jgi:hypothetical protein
MSPDGSLSVIRTELIRSFGKKRLARHIETYPDHAII